MNQTRPTSLTEDDRRQLDRLHSLLRGANVTVMDDRVTKVQTWLLPTIGSTLILVGGWGIVSINKLNETMMQVLTENRYRDDKVQALENRFERHLNDVVKTIPDAR